jgi:phosphohistidine phosphatase
MLLLLVRHALAEDRDDDRFPDDSLRPLVARGRKAQQRLARWLAKRGMVPTTVLSSPWKRAWQSAGILAKETGAGKKSRVQCPPLAEDPKLEAIAAAVGPRETDEVVALVGHEPWMGEFASLLLTGSPTRLAVDFPKSGVLAIDIAAIGAAAGRLRFLYEP